MAVFLERGLVISTLHGQKNGLKPSFLCKLQDYSTTISQIDTLKQNTEKL